MGLAKLLAAIDEHARACEAKVSKDAWSLANAELLRARREAELVLRSDED